MQKKCRRCGDTFTVKTYEDYCPECEKVMAPPSGGVSRELTCEGCRATFIHKKEKAQGRWPKYCPECLPKYSKVPKKEEEVVKSEEEPDKNTEETHIEDSKKLTVYTPTIKRADEQGIRIRSAQLRANLCLIADQYDLAVVFLRRINCPADNLLRRKIAAHRINCYTHPALPSPLLSSFSK